MHTKILVNSTIQFCESRHQKKKCLAKVWSFLALSPQYEDPLKFLHGNYLLIATIFKLHKYQAFSLIKMAKSDLPIIILVCEKVWFAVNRPSKVLFFNFCLFHFSKFQVTIVKNLMKNHPFYNWFQRFL